MICASTRVLKPQFHSFDSNNKETEMKHRFIAKRYWKDQSTAMGQKKDIQSILTSREILNCVRKFVNSIKKNMI